MNTMHYQIKQKLIKLDVKVSLRSNAYVKNVINSTNVAVISLNQYIVIKNYFE